MQPKSELEQPLIIDRRRLVVACLELVVHVQRPAFREILDFWNRATAALGNVLTHYRSGSMRQPAAIDGRAQSMVETWVSRPRIGYTYQMEACGAGPRAGCSAGTVTLVMPVPPDPPGPEQSVAERDRRRDIYERARCVAMPPVTTLRLTIPLEHPLAEPAALRAWMQDLAVIDHPDVASGYAGRAFNYDESVGNAGLRAAMEARMAALTARHPGLGWYHAGSITRKLMRYLPETVDFVPQVKRANWWTLLANSTLAMLGGRAAARRTLDGPDVELQDVGGGLSIFAQRAPATGDVTCGEYLEAYRRVAAFVRPMRLRDHLPVGRVFDAAAVLAWLNALDDPIETEARA